MAKSKTTTPTKSNNTASSSIGVSAEDILWRKRGSRYNAFGPPDTDGKQSVLELTLKGTVLNSYLRAGALSHTVSIEVSQTDLEQCWESCVTVRPHDTGPGPILVSRSCSDCNLMFKSRIRVVSVLTTFKVGSGSVDNQKVHGYSRDKVVKWEITQIWHKMHYSRFTLALLAPVVLVMLK